MDEEFYEELEEDGNGWWIYRGGGATAPLRVVRVRVHATVTAIPDDSFRDCMLTEINFRICSQLTAIGDSAFFGCRSLPSIQLPNSITSLGDVSD
jgi:hypothetical protein